MTIAGTTKFRAVQMLLDSIQVSSNITAWSDSDTGPPDSNNLQHIVAFNCVEDAVREVNIEHNYQWNWTESRTFTLDGSGRAVKPANLVRIDYILDEKDSVLNQDRLVERDGFIYNATTETNVLGAAGATKRFKVTYWPEFKELPESVRLYVVAVARVNFIRAVKGADTTLLNHAESQKIAAKAKIWQDHSLRVKRNIREGDAARVSDMRFKPTIQPLA